MKRTFLMLAMSLVLLAIPMKTSAQYELIYRNMFPVADMAEEMTDALDYELNLTNRQYDEIFFYYYDWIEDVLDRMEYDGLFPMTIRTFDRFVEKGCRYFYDTDSAYRERRRVFSDILTRYQFKKWIRLEEQNRYGVVNVYVYAFPRFSYYDARVHRYYIYNRPPRPNSYHRHDYHPAPNPGHGPRHPYNPSHINGGHPSQQPGGGHPSQQPSQTVPPSTSQGNRNHNSPGYSKPAGGTPTQRPAAGNASSERPATGNASSERPSAGSNASSSKPNTSKGSKAQRTNNSTGKSKSTSTSKGSSSSKSTSSKGSSSSNKSTSSGSSNGNNNRTNPVKR